LSFGNLNKVFGTIQEALILALMLVTMLALFYADIDFSYKIGIAIFAFAVIFLATISNAILKQQRELRKKQLQQA
jgi:uncharacterized membrane protein